MCSYWLTLRSLGASRKQKTTVQSSTEAEYMGLAEAGNQATWYRMFLEELGYEVRHPIPLHGDNKGSVDLSLNPVTGRKSKHIPIKHHVICNYIENDQVELLRADFSYRAQLFPELSCA